MEHTKLVWELEVAFCSSSEFKRPHDILHVEGVEGKEIATIWYDSRYRTALVYKIEGQPMEVVPLYAAGPVDARQFVVYKCFQLARFGNYSVVEVPSER